MRLHEWEVAIQEIVEKCKHEERRQDKVLLEWRAKMEKEPSCLRPSQIDELVREVRRRLSKVSR